MDRFFPMFMSLFWLLIIGGIIFAVISRRQQQTEKLSPRVGYFYFVSFVGLFIVSCSFSYLLGNGVELLITDFQLGVEEKKNLSLAFAFFLVSSPVWFFHWYKASGFQDSEQSTVIKEFRSKYLYVVLGFSGVVFLLFAGWVIYKVFNKILGVSDFDRHFFSRFLGFALTNLGIWFYHWFITKKESA